MTKTRKEWQDEWIAALRSGDYKQSQHELYDGNGYCCLGVAYKLFHGNMDAHMAKPDGRSENLTDYPEVVNAFGFRGPNGDFSKVIGLGFMRGNAVTFIGLNDRKGMTFSEIADLAEKHRDIVFLPEVDDGVQADNRDG